MTKTAIKQRDGNVMVKVSVETTPAVIQFSDILEACEVKPDEDAEAPWDNCDGYEHEVIKDNTDGESAGSFRDGRGRMMRCVTSEFEDWGSAPSGASKQVVFEAHAAEVKRTLQQLAKWHGNGWEVFGVVCNFQGYHDSCWGFYDDEGCDGPYMRENIREIAGNVAAQMVKGGYTVEGWQPWTGTDRNAYKKNQIRQRLNLVTK